MTFRRGVCFLVGAFSVSSVEAQETLNVRLQFTPEVDTRPAGVIGLSEDSIWVLPLTDAREGADRSLIGENRQSKNRPIPVRSSSSIPEFATGALKTCLSAWGVRLAPTAKLVLRGEIITLFATEANKYQGEARFRFFLETSEGKRLWEGIVSGDDWTWGRDLNPQNYNQVISDAMKKAYAALLNDQRFQDAWAGKGAGVRPPIAPQELTPEELMAKHGPDGTESKKTPEQKQREQERWMARYGRQQR